MTTRRLLAIGAAFSGMLLPALASAQAIQGFGKSVPFGTAARQIVPSEMLLNIDTGVDATGRVNWSGGADWHSVLEQLAASRNARVSYEGQLVHIQSNSAPSVAMVQPSTPMVQSSTPMLSRGGLMVLAEGPPQAPIMLQAVPAPVVLKATPVPVMLQAVPAPIVLQAVPGPVVIQATPAPVMLQAVPAPVVVQAAPGPIVLQAVPAPGKPPAVVVSAPGTVVVATPTTVVVATPQPVLVPEVKETPRQKAERSRAERAADKEARLQAKLTTTREPSIRNAAPAQVQPNTTGIWRAGKGESLEHVLSDWGDRAGWTVVYNSQVVYDIQSGAEFRGDFTEAAASLVRSLHFRVVPSVVFYRGNKTLVVSNTTDGN